MATGPTFYLLPTQTPDLLVWCAAIGGAGAWVGVHWAISRFLRHVPGLLRWLLCVGFAWTTCLLGLQALTTVLVFGGKLPPWGAALLAGVGVETIFALYRLEQRTARLRRPRWLGFIRAALVLLAILLLVKPVYRTVRRWQFTRQAVVLLDDSASMQTADDRMPLDQRLRLAEMLAADFPDPSDSLRATEEAVLKVRTELRELAALIGAPGAREGLGVSSRAVAVQATIRACLKTLRPVVAALKRRSSQPGNLAQAIARQVAGVGNALGTGAVAPLVSAIQSTTAARGSSLPRDLAATLGHVTTVLGSVAQRLSALVQEADQAFYSGLGPGVQQQVDVFSKTPRTDLARLILFGANGPAGRRNDPHTLIGRLRKEYRVRVFRFAAHPAPLPLGAAPTGSSPANRASGTPDTPGAPSPPDSEHLRTDLAAALDAALQEATPDHLAGIIVLSDGRHNAPASVEPAAHQLGLLHVPVSSIVFGYEQRPPTDAAILSVRAPETVYTGDTLFVDAEIACNGLSGKKMKLTLVEGDDPLESTEFTVDSVRSRQRLSLNAPCTQAGLRHLRLVLNVPNGDACPENNAYELAVRVRNDHIGVLLIDNRPRWEFRYLKNLFIGRDRTVRTQAVLLQPDRVAGSAEGGRPSIAASLTRAPQHCEADLPPASPEEWLKFDVIILGDVPASRLPGPEQTVIRRFVEKRAGTLVVVAGAEHMPREFRNAPLAELLPAACALPEGSGGSSALRPPEEQWRIQLTSAGVEHVLMRLAPDRAASQELWRGVPPFFWRHPGLTAKPQATVLAWALPPEHPRFLEGKDLTVSAGSERQKYVREHAVIMIQRFGLGRVVLLAFDETWRLRFRKGDTLHHRFWGQLLRWAAADKLPAGGNGAWLGVDRGRYAQGMPVQVRAKLLRPDHAPITDATPRVKLLSGKQTVGRYPLRFVPDSAGVYETRLDGLPSGAYRLELERAGKPGESRAGEPAHLEFVVAPVVGTEQAELAPNRDLLERLASLTGGRVVSPSNSFEVLDALAPARATLEEKRDWSLWNSWLFWMLFLSLACAEWLLRKRAGLP